MVLEHLPFWYGTLLETDGGGETVVGQEFTHTMLGVDISGLKQGSFGESGGVGGGGGAP